MLCICDAVGTTLLLYERTKEVGIYSCCYGVIPGWYQESSLWVYSVLSRALCYILWVCTIFRQKNIRTKELIECSDVCSIELDKHMLIQCCASAMQRTLLYFCMEEQKKWAFTLVATTSFLAGTRNLISGSSQCFAVIVQSLR